MVEKGKSDPETLLVTMLGAEGGLARLEGLLAGDSRLAKLWSSQAILVEAVRCVSLEDVRIRESDLFLRVSSGRTTEIDARGAETAMNIMRLLQRSPDITSDPAGVIRMLERELRLRPPSIDPDERYPMEGLSDSTLNEVVEEGRAYKHTPVIAALRVATRYSRETDGISPPLERVVMALVDSTLRNMRSDPDPVDDHTTLDPIAELGRPGRLTPVCLPATALAWSGSSAWSLRNTGGLLRCLQALRDHARRELGAIGVLRHWIMRMDGLREDVHGRSNLGALLDLILEQPVLTSRIVVERIGVSRRSAINLLNLATEHGMLKVLTNRRAARIWGTPMMVERLRVTHAAPAVTSSTIPDRPAPSGTWAEEQHSLRGQPLREQSQQAVQDALDALDAALVTADELIARSKTHARWHGDEASPFGDE